ncbi:MAG: hypothetical protein HGA96_07975 [Desulfobulbaceae bacterium]|nr:hypothetical protein [Desulfobulbaceae bacterium]
MANDDQTRKTVEEGKLLLAWEQAKKLVEEGKALLADDLRGGLAKLRQARAIAPDYPDLEDEIFLREDALEKLDSLLDYTVILLKDHKDYQACQMLKDLPENYIIEDRTQLLGDLTSRISRAEGLIENSRNLPKTVGSSSLRSLEEAMGLVPDYPGLQDEIAVVRASLVRHQAYLDTIEESIRCENFAKAAELLKAFREVYPDDMHIRKFEMTIQNRKQAVRMKQLLLKNLRTGSVAVAVLAVLGGGYYAYETWMVNGAARDWDNLTRLLDEKKFAEVQSGGKEIIGKLAKVRFFGGDKKGEILAKVTQVLQSETVKQGAIGNAMVDGGFVPVGDVDKVNNTKKLLTEGANLAAADNFSQAVAKFEEARTEAASLGGDVGAKYGEEIKSGLRAAQEGGVRQVLEESRKLKGAGNFDGAVAKLNEASELAARYGLPAAVTASAADGAYQEIEVGRYRDMVGTGDKQLASGRFDEAIASYERALAFAEAKKLAGSAQPGKLRESIALAKVSIWAAKGDEFVKRSRWADAMASYGAALKLSEESGLKKDLPVYRQATDNLGKARRLVALEELRGGEREAQKYFEAGEWAKARKSYEREVALVDKGAYAADQEFAALRKSATSRLVEVDEKLFLAGKKDYLLERHRAYLKQAFGIGGEVALLDPSVVLLGAEGDTLKYSLSARSYQGKGTAGVYTVYEVVYAYNRKSDNWVLLDKKSGSKASAGQ